MEWMKLDKTAKAKRASLPVKTTNCRQNSFDLYDTFWQHISHICLSFYFNKINWLSLPDILHVQIIWYTSTNWCWCCNVLTTGQNVLIGYSQCTTSLPLILMYWKINTNISFLSVLVLTYTCDQRLGQNNLNVFKYKISLEGFQYKYYEMQKVFKYKTLWSISNTFYNIAYSKNNGKSSIEICCLLT